MDLVSLLILLVIAGICGAIAEVVVGFSPGGFVASIAVGLIGAFAGGWLIPRLGLPQLLMVSRFLPNTPFDFDLIWSVLGAVLLLFVISLVRGAGRSRRSL